jgi:hypothetical protein
MDTTTTSDTRGRPAVEPVDDRLSDLLEAEVAYDPVARGGYINHTAMALVAAWRLGADADQLDGWYRADVDSGFIRLRPEPEGLAEVRDEVLRRGTEAAVHHAGPALVHSPASQFFHAPIRLEYALDAGHTSQVANALHNWRFHGRALADLPDGGGGRPFADVARDVAAADGWRTVHRGDLDEVARAGWFTDLLGGADLASPTLLDEVAAVAAAAHVAGGDIGSLHLVTGTRAARAIAPLLDADDARTLAARTAQAVAAGLDPGAAPLPEAHELDALRHRPVPSWDAIAEAALASGDPHGAKLAYTCRREQEATGDALYAWLAARRCGLVDP